MEDIELKEKLKKTKGRLSGALMRWLGRYIELPSEGELAAGKLLGGICKGLISFVFAFVFSRAAAFGGTLPFGLALLCGSEKRVLYILGGILLSSMMGEEYGIYFVSAVLIAVLRLLVSYVLEGRQGKMFREPIAMRLAIGSAGGFVIGIYRIFAGGFKQIQLYEALFMICAVPIAAYIYSGALGKKMAGTSRRDIGAIALYCTLILGLSNYSLYGFSFAIVAATLLTLATALGGGSLKGGLIGMLGGMCVGSIFCPIIGLVGAVCGSARRHSAILSVAAACGCGIALSIVFQGGVSLISTVPAILWGGAICLPVNRFGFSQRLSVIEGRSLMSEEAGNAAMLVSKREEEMRTRLNALSEAMTSLSGVFYALSNRLSTPGVYQVHNLCESSFKKYCRSCGKSTVCWGREYERTADVMNKLASAVARHGSADSSYVPNDFLTSCPHAPKALSEVNLSHARLLESAARQNKTEVFALDYEAMAKLLEEASEENSSEYIIDQRLTEKVRGVAIDMSLGFHSIAVYGKRRKTVIAGGVELDRVHLSSEEMREAFGSACGVRLTVPEFKVDDDYVTMTATRAPILSCESARASAKKKDEDVNGDSAIVFSNREDKHYALISDGMGSGQDASMTSRMTSIFLEKLLSSGNGKHTVLKMLNNFIRNKNLECFATVDLLEIDLLSGNASFIKSGAAASYIIRDGKLFKISSTSLPIGITREIASEEIKFDLKERDLIIMVSDGVSQSFEDGVWLLSMLSDEIKPDSPLTTIARSILEKAKVKNERSDDMTVIALRISKAG